MSEEGEGSLEVVIKTINNESYNINLPLSSSVQNLKNILQERTSIEVERQRLIYRGKVLSDPDTVRSYNIENGHTIHMVARPANFRELQRDSQPTSPGVTPAPTTLPPSIAPPITTPTQTRIETIPLSSIGGPQIRSIRANRPDTRTPTQPTTTTTPNEPNFEPLRQSLLTLRTVMSTMERPREERSIVDSKEEDVVDGNAESKEQKIGASDATIPAPLPPERRFFIGQWIDVKDTVQQWLEATVMDINYTSKLIFVHYNGWPQRWDEWISFDSPRVAPFRSRTSHSPLHDSLCPHPNHVVGHAPLTGINDMRMIFPELASLFRTMLPMVEELGQISEASLRNNPNTTVQRPPNLAAGMPWDEFHSTTSPVATENSEQLFENDSEKSSDAEAIAESSDEINNSYAGRSRFSPANAVTNAATSSSVDRAAVEERYKQLCRDLCPLFDRFGRTFTDLAPHLWQYAEPDSTLPRNPAARGSDPFHSLEARLISLLRERPPSPPPMHAYRAPISAPVPRPETVIGARGMNPILHAIESSILADAGAAGLGTPLNTVSGANGGATTGGAAATSSGTAGTSGGRRPTEHHVDIHIAILSPPTRPTTAASVDSLSRTVANLTASLQAQAQSLAARTQELSERTSAVSNITSAISEALRNATNNNASSTNSSEGNNGGTEPSPVEDATTSGNDSAPSEQQTAAPAEATAETQQVEVSYMVASDQIHDSDDSNPFLEGLSAEEQALLEVLTGLQGGDDEQDEDDEPEEEDFEIEHDNSSEENDLMLDFHSVSSSARREPSLTQQLEDVDEDHQIFEDPPNMLDDLLPSLLEQRQDQITLMPENAEETSQLPYWNIPNQQIQQKAEEAQIVNDSDNTAAEALHKTPTHETETPSSPSDESHIEPSTSPPALNTPTTPAEGTSEDDVEDRPSTSRSPSLFQRIRRSIFR